jgi:hypothetical protein
MTVKKISTHRGKHWRRHAFPLFRHVTELWITPPCGSRIGAFQARMRA